MRRIIALTHGLLFGCVLHTVAANYYVATNGTAGGTGTIGNPFGSIQSAVSAAGPGDTVYLRGGKYREAISITGLNGTSSNPVVFAAYPGEMPILSGTVPVTSGWSVHSGSIWKTTLAQDTFQLFVDDKMMTAARWPNIDPGKDFTPHP